MIDLNELYMWCLQSINGSVINNNRKIHIQTDYLYTVFKSSAINMILN